MTRTAIGIGGGKLLSRTSYRAQINPHIGFGHKSPKRPASAALAEALLRLSASDGDERQSRQWLLQNPLFAGKAGIESYLPSQRISIAIAMTFKPTAYNAEGNPSPYWQVLWGKIGRSSLLTTRPRYRQRCVRRSGVGFGGSSFERPLDRLLGALDRLPHRWGRRAGADIRVPPGPRMSIVRLVRPRPAVARGIGSSNWQTDHRRERHLDAVGDDHSHRTEQVVDLEHRLPVGEPRLAKVEVNRAEDQRHEERLGSGQRTLRIRSSRKQGAFRRRPPVGPMRPGRSAVASESGQLLVGASGMR